MQTGTQSLLIIGREYQGCQGGGHSGLQLQAALLLAGLWGATLCPQNWEEPVPYGVHRGEWRLCICVCVCTCGGMGNGKRNIHTYRQANMHAHTQREKI